MAGATFHEKKDYIFALPQLWGIFGRVGLFEARASSRFIGKSRQCNGSKTRTCGVEKMTAVEWLVDLEAGHD